MTTIKKLALVLALSLLPVSGVLDRAIALRAAAKPIAQNNSQVINEPDLISPETRINYNSLRQLLETKQWRKANDRTQELMLRATNRKAQGWISTQNLENFPCWDLKTIDNLWKKYSQGRFGFSVQFPIFLETGNKPGRLVDVDAYEQFGDRVGWRKQQEWVDFKENLIYNLDAPIGHLPNPRQEYQISGGRLEYVTLSKRMVSCQLVTNLTNVTSPNNTMPSTNKRQK
ncbi:GUN4 domain-containing protein [Candidatus Gracilibacteria bacterium]|nr:GUN4 domain-containing protein [Candidatus Gracilibacteria bacterium]NJM87160.1 GUN4 domain-containing protein [Hydrococcus sp. RU_2_2]NJP20055.1 GUN4 domain-containing protein [Hydrococcus sp. CRU_1_1]